MPATYNAFLHREFFDRAQAYSTTPGMNGWTFKKTGAGTPTCLNVSNRGVAITLDNTSEAQIACLYQNDVLPWAISEIEWIDLLVKVAGLDSVSTLAFGLGSAQNNTLDSVTYGAWWRMEGSASLSNVVAETDDNTTNTDDIATGTTLSTSFKRFVIDLTQGLDSPRFIVNGLQVASGSALSLAAMATTQAVQPMFQIQKASGTGTPSMTIGAMQVKLRYSYP